MTNNSETRILRVSLNDVEPEIWRVIEVEADITLGGLHGALVGAMGWEDSHLHSFMVDDASHSTVLEGIETIGGDEEDLTVAEALPEIGSLIRWLYDWGDGWDHTVTVEDTGTMQPGVTYPFLYAGARACPPEDCGGPWGYAELLRGLRDPNHPDREDLLAMAPPGFDPTRFDLHEAQTALRAPRPLEGW